MGVWVMLGAAALAIGPAPTAADAVTLKDGAVVLGQLADPAPRGPLSMLVRRAWAEARLPEQAARWRKSEAPALKRARAQRHDRLAAWKRERVPEEGRDDPIAAWIDAELARLDGAAVEDAGRSRLMIVSLDRREIKAIARRPRDSGRLLRLGWRINLERAEEMPLADLKAAVEGRGFLANGTEPVPLDDLLPVQPEPDGRWLARRAATEVVNEPGLRLVRYQGLVLPEGGQPGAPADAAQALGALKGLLGDPQAEDPLAAKLREAAGRGRVGLVLTRLDMEPDFSAVKVESTLFVRSGRDGWGPAASRPATIRTDDLRPDAGEELAADPQVQAAFRIVEGLGLGQVDPAMKSRGLKVGAATRKALHLAQGALDRDLQAWAIPIAEPPRE